MLNSISSYSSIATRKGIGGLASGLDTDTLIEGMTSSTRNKILKQLQNREILSWKMDAYQGITDKLRALSDKYTSFANASTNLVSSKFFSNYTVTSQGSNASAVSMSGNSSTLSDLKILGVNSLASAAGFSTAKAASSQKFSTDTIDFSAAGKTVNDLAGKTVYVKYDNKSYAVTIDKNFKGTTASEVASAFNKAFEKVTIDKENNITLASKLQMSSSNNSLMLNAKDANAETPEFGFDVISEELSKMLGFSDESKTSGTNMLMGTLDTGKLTHQLNFKDTMNGKSITFTYNGIDKVITFPDTTAEDYDATSDTWESVNNINTFQSYLQGKIDKAFGSGKITVSANPDASGNGNGTLSFATTDTNSTLRFKAAGDNIAGTKGVLGMTIGSTNRLRMDLSLDELAEQGAAPITAGNDGKYKIKVNDQEFEFTGEDLLSDVINKINNSDAGVSIKYLSTTDRFSVTATETGAHGRVEISDVAGEGNLVSTLFGNKGTGLGDYTVNAGTDASMTIQYGTGQQITLNRSTNSFELDGANVTINSKFTSSELNSATGTGDPITFTSKVNADDMVSVIKDMVKDYNEIIDLVNTQMTEKRNRDYQPLSKEQEDEMTEAQVKEWNAKAKAGMLFGDSALQSLASDLRFAFSFVVDGVGNPGDIGITTSSSYTDNGKIVLDEAKLKAALEKDPDMVRRMFTTEKSVDENGKEIQSATNGGLMVRVKDVLDKYAATTGDKGILVQRAGVKDSIWTKDSALYKEMESIQKTIDKLQLTLQAEETRYYNQFTALEKYISQMNNQSNWLAQQFG